MIAYDVYENLIVKRLEHPDWDVSPLPLIVHLNSAQERPKIHVIFSGSTFEDVANFGDFTQNEPLTFEVLIYARTRDGERGVFAVAEEVIQRLLKWKLLGANLKISLTSFGYVEGIQNNWCYSLKFTFPRVRVMREETDDPKLITKVEHLFIDVVKNENV